MRSLYVLLALLVLAACAKSNNRPVGDYRPGGPFTLEDVAEDRKAPWAPVEKVDRTDLRETPRTEEIEIPLKSEEGASSAEQTPQKVQLLLNQMKVQDTKISVGKKAGLVRLSATALINEKPVVIKLEGHLNEDSTADLTNVEDGDESVRAEVFCRGEVRENFYDCESLFVDLYYKIEDNKFYREQLELESEQEKAQKAKEAAVAAQIAAAHEQEANQDPEEEGDHGDIPEPLGTYVGRPERVKQLFGTTKKPEPIAKEQSPVREQPVGKGPGAPSKKEKPSAESMNNSASSSQAKPKTKPKTPSPAAKRNPAPPVPQPTAKPAPVTTPVATPEPTATPTPTPNPAPVVVARPKPEVTVVPARVALDVNDEQNRPTDQAVGGYSGGGKLENASTLDFDGDYHYFSKPQERQNYATYDLVRVVKLLAAKIYKEIFPGIKIRINDFSARKGGYLPPHKGHQNGLEADIGYLTVNSDKKQPQHAMLNGKWLGTMKMKEMWSVFKFLAASDRVSLFYVNKAIKPRFCSYASSQGELNSEKGKLALSKMTAISSHTSHFHLRMECSRYNPRCRKDGDTPKNTGC